jgi:glycosyltransferase involved in cell wall biosynthesis
MEKKKMEKKICFIATHVYPLFNPKEKSSYGGSEVQLYTIAKELSKDENNNVSFIVGDFKQKKYEYHNNIKVIKSFNPKSSGSSIFAKAIQALRYIFILAKENPDICITSSAHSTVGVVGIYCKLFRKKHIHRIANIIDVNGYWINNNGILGKIYDYGLKNASHIVCQTHDQKKALKENYNINATLFRNVFDFENIKPPKSKKYILWVARANRTKRAEHFLELAQQNPDLRFVMICNKQKVDYYNEIYKKAKKIKNLEFIEKVPFHKIQKYYDNAKLFISTSEFEGFANTFIQSGIAKTPIISLSSNPDDFINKYECGYFAQDSTEKLNEYTRKLLADKKTYEKFSENIHKYVKEKYDIRNNIKVIKKVIDDVSGQIR